MMFSWRHYSLPATASASLHIGLVALAFFAWSASPPVEPPKPMEYVKATLVDMTAKAPERRAAAAPVIKKDVSAQDKVQTTREEKPERQEAQAPTPKPDEVQPSQPKPDIKPDDSAAKQAALKQLEQEKADKAKKIHDAKQREKAEAERRAEQERRRKAQEAADRAREDEEMMLAEEAAAEAVASYESLLQQRVQDQWSRPPSARNGMSCQFVINMVPSGRIVAINLVRSSGDAAFDRSAEQALQAVDSIPEFKDLDPVVFERYFRTIRFTFQPEDLRQ
jgi:colicin import membrane protein